MVFWLRPQRTWLDWTLFWLLFVNFMILPTDVLCPAWLHEYIHKTFWLDVYTYFICWLRIVWWAVGPKEELKAESVKLKILLPLLMLSLPLGTMAQRRPATKVFSVKGVQFKMQFVQGGTFTMGALPHDPLADDDEVRHRVLVNNFYIGETEVTQELWEAVMLKNRSKHRGNGQWPVEYVTYDMCKDFIRRLNALTGEHFRLPTEAEWEYAARGGKKSKGYLYAGSNRIEEVAYKNMEERIPMPVAQFKPNELGLYDMSGNVWEWCEDWYRKTPTSKPSSNFHVIRGGGYDCSPRYCRSTNRYFYDQRRRRDLVGFRLALSPHFSINSFRDR
jgi:formylglycine-generating enzyme required for sulfatase activity